MKWRACETLLIAAIAFNVSPFLYLVTTAIIRQWINNDTTNTQNYNNNKHTAHFIAKFLITMQMLRAFCSLYRNVDDVCHIIPSVVTTEIDEIKDHHALYINCNFILTSAESLFLLISAQQSLQLQFDFFQF